MPLTKEERKARALNRKAEEARLRKTFPSSYLGFKGNMTLLHEGEPVEATFSLYMETGHEGYLVLNAHSDLKEIDSVSVDLGANLYRTAKFIRALVARYNHEVSLVNSEVEGIKVLQLKEIVCPSIQASRSEERPAIC